MVAPTRRRIAPLALAQAFSLRFGRPERPAWSEPSPATRTFPTPRRLIVRTLELRDYRSYARLELELEPGIVLAVGPNGAGKTNLLESLHVAAQGFSPRTRSDAQLIRFGEQGARIAVSGERGGG